VRAALLLLLMLLAPAPGAARPSSISADALAGLAFREHPGAHLPLDAVLRDEDGEPVRLGRFFTGKPVVLVLDYLGCKTLCGLVLGDLVAALDALPLDAGRDFQVVAVSIDPRDTPAAARAAKAAHLAQYRHPGAAQGWHFLTGTEPSVRRVADAVGFPYRYDPAIDQYAHPAGVVLAAPDGTIARYLLGVGYRPDDLRLGLAEAGRGRVTSVLSHLLLLCYGYDPQQGRYTPAITAAMMAINLGAMLAAAAIMVAVWRKRRGEGP
jgi:protein SCO1